MEKNKKWSDLTEQQQMEEQYKAVQQDYDEQRALPHNQHGYVDEDDAPEIYYQQDNVCGKCKGQCPDCNSFNSCHHGSDCSCTKAKTCSPCQMYPMKPFPHVWMDIAGGNVGGRVELELYADTPKTSENFRCLMTGEKGLGKLGK